MGVRTARRIGTGGFALWTLASLLALPTVVARADARGDWGGFALLLGLLAVVLAGFGASLRARTSGAEAFTMSGWRLLGLIMTGLPISFSLTALALGWSGVFRPLLVVAILAYGATAGTEPPPEGWAPRGEPWVRWLVLRWRWGFFGVLLFGAISLLCGGDIFPGLFAGLVADRLCPYRIASLIKTGANASGERG